LIADLSTVGTYTRADRADADELDRLAAAALDHVRAKHDAADAAEAERLVAGVVAACRAWADDHRGRVPARAVAGRRAGGLPRCWIRCRWEKRELRGGKSGSAPAWERFVPFPPLTPTGRYYSTTCRNAVLVKVLCRNAVAVSRGMDELGIAPEFGNQNTAVILKFPGCA
jgi:hypothetical protein